MHFLARLNFARALTSLGDLTGSVMTVINTPVEANDSYFCPRRCYESAEFYPASRLTNFLMEEARDFKPVHSGPDIMPPNFQLAG